MFFQGIRSASKLQLLPMRPEWECQALVLVMAFWLITKAHSMLIRVEQDQVNWPLKSAALKVTVGHWHCNYTSTSWPYFLLDETETPNVYTQSLYIGIYLCWNLEWQCAEWKYMVTITSGGSRLCHTERGHGEGFREGTPSPKARAKWFGGGSPTHFLRKLRRDSILSEKHSKLTKHSRQLLPVAAASLWWIWWKIK